MLAAAIYQRYTGPTYPRRGFVEIAGKKHTYRLPRSETTAHDARIALPDPGDGTRGEVHYKRFGTEDALTQVEMRPEEGELVARLPSQPPAGKLCYFVRLRGPWGELRLPAGDGDDIVIRFKGAVPLFVLLPHVVLMFLSILVGLRAGLAALFDPAQARPLAWLALAGMTVGGMVLGPIVQKHAFGAYWTGWPYGYDLTDNKTLLLWISWVGACSTLFRKRAAPGRWGRGAVVTAAVVMLSVYLIPHSLRGSTLDYRKLDQGVPADKAIESR